MKYQLEYKFGGGYKYYVAEDHYDMERVISFMEEKWNIFPTNIKYIREVKDEI